MPIIGLQRRIREVGRIRIGEQVATRNGKTRPTKLDTFRFTSRDQRIIEAVAHRYGGTVKQWDSPDGPQSEVITATDAISVLLPPTEMAHSIWFETWTAGGCQRRCDGQWDTIRDQPCDCNPENRVCKMVTRLNVILVDIPGLGVWRVETKGYYAGTELAAAIELASTLTSMGKMLPARLLLEQRHITGLNDDGEVQTNRFAVLALTFDVRAADMMVGPTTPTTPDALNIAPSQPSLPDVEGQVVPAPETDTSGPALPPSWQPQPAQPEPPALTIREQLDEPPPTKKKRSNSAEPLKSTGRKPRKATEVTDVDTTCDICGERYGADPLIKNPIVGGSRWIHRACYDDQTTPATNPASQAPDSKDVGHENGGGGGKDVEPARSGNDEPAPATTPSSHPNPMGYRQQRKLFALMPEALPSPDGMHPAGIDEWRRNQILTMCAVCGRDDITSRSQIDGDLANRLINALEEMIAGTLRWTGDRFIGVDPKAPA